MLRGAALGVGLVGIIVMALLPVRQHVGSTAPALLFTVVAAASAAIGGAPTAVLVSIAAAAALDLAFLRPYGTLSVLTIQDGVALGSFLAVAGTVGVLVAAQRDARLDAEEREHHLRDLTGRLQAMAREREELTERPRVPAIRLG